MFRIALVLAAVAMVATPSIAANRCRGEHGRFIKCPPVAKKVVRCKDAKGKFAKCGTPGAKPV
jgi:hypothetical protein